VKGYLVLGDEERALSKLGAHSNGRAFQFETLRQAVPSDCSDLKSLVRGLKQGAEKEVILHALEQTRGSRKEAAAMLKISLRALQYKIREYGIDQTDAQSTPHAA